MLFTFLLVWEFDLSKQKIGLQSPRGSYYDPGGFIRSPLMFASRITYDCTADRIRSAASGRLAKSSAAHSMEDGKGVAGSHNASSILR